MRVLPEILFVFFVASSCIEVFEQEVARQTNILLVEGQLFNHPDHQFVKLYFTDSTGQRTPVRHAFAAIHDVEGNEWLLSETKPGEYRHHPGMIDVLPGDRFRLEISIGDSIQAVSSLEEIPVASKIDSVFLIPKFIESVNDQGFSVFQKGIEIFATTMPLPTDEVYLRWTYEEAYGYVAPNASELCSECEYCYVVEHPTNINNIVQVSGGDKKILSSHPINFVRVSEKFDVRYGVLVKQLTITRKAYEYYSAIKQINDARGSIFDPPPAVLHGNIVNQLEPARPIYGFFETGQYSEATAFIVRPNIPFLVPSAAEKCRESSIPPPECSDCRYRTGATKNRPYYY